MSMASETLEVTIKYNGIKGERMLSRTMSQTEAVRILLADLLTLRVHRPKGENILQEGATFFLLWCHPANAPVPLARGTLYRRWLDIVEGSPELTAIKEKLSIESVTLRRIQSNNAGVHGTTLSPLGPKHTIELPRIEGMSSHAERFSYPSAVGRPYLQQPILATEITQGKRPRSNPIDERSPLSPSSGSVGNDECPLAPSRKKIRMEEHSSIRSSASEERNAPGGFTAGEHTTSQVENKFPQSRPPMPFSTTHQRELRIPPCPLDSNSSASPGVSNMLVPTGAHPSGDRGAVEKLSLELTKVRGELATLHSREQGILEELARRGASPLGTFQPKVEETTPSLNDMEAQLMLVEIELQQERIQRLRAEHTLGEVEKECRSPFVVPALFQAFRRILDIGRRA